jgi:hypothetical protein
MHPVSFSVWPLSKVCPYVVSFFLFNECMISCIDTVVMLSDIQFHSCYQFDVTPRSPLKVNRSLGEISPRPKGLRISLAKYQDETCH